MTEFDCKCVPGCPKCPGCRANDAIRAAVAEERERCVAILAAELTPGQDPYGFQVELRELIERIREEKP